MADYREQRIKNGFNSPHIVSNDFCARNYGPSTIFLYASCLCGNGESRLYDMFNVQVLIDKTYYLK